jgi:hypothetical protein
MAIGISGGKEIFQSIWIIITSFDISEANQRWESQTRLRRSTKAVLLLGSRYITSMGLGGYVHPSIVQKSHFSTIPCRILSDRPRSRCACQAPKLVAPRATLVRVDLFEATSDSNSETLVDHKLLCKGITRGPTRVSAKHRHSTERAEGSIQK